MTKTITIRETKGIRELLFTLPDKQDVYLLVGANGTGKSTLLVCLDRLCRSWAFGDGFRSSHVPGTDQYSDASITYAVGDENVVFKKGTAKWVSTPRSNTKLLKKFGFSGSIFIKTDSKRFEPLPQDVREGQFQSAERAVCEALNEIFETDKYSRLQRLKNSHGRGRTSVFFYVIPQNETQKYTEKRFSSGELAVIRLIEQLHTATSNTLVLLDEAEMALHPRVQRKLLEYIKKIAKEKNLTVFIATHSVTMIHMMDKRNIYLLETNHSTGKTEVISPCYPANAVGSVDFIEHAGFDYLFFVEDDMARILLQKMIERYSVLEKKYAKFHHHIVPVGGLLETAKFAIKTKHRVFAGSKVFALLDDDAFHGKTPRLDAIRKGNEDTVQNLGCTPEVYFINKLEAADVAFATVVRNDYLCEIPNILRDERYVSCKADNVRKLAKKQFDVFIDILCASTGDHEDVVRDRFIALIADTMPGDELKKVLGPIFSR